MYLFECLLFLRSSRSSYERFSTSFLRNRIMSNNQDQLAFSVTNNVTESPRWAKDIEAVLQPETRQMLQYYAGTPSDQQVDHIERTPSYPSHSAPSRPQQRH
jgi:hypothetical protein